MSNQIEPGEYVVLWDGRDSFFYVGSFDGEHWRRQHQTVTRPAPIAIIKKHVPAETPK